MKRNKLTLVVLTVALCACTKSTKTAAPVQGGNVAESAQPSGAVPSVQASDNSGGTVGPLDSRARALVTSPPRGASSVDPGSAHILVSVSCPLGGVCATDQAGTASMLAAKMRLTDGVDTVAVTPDALPAAAAPSPGKTDQPVTLPQNEYSLGFRPASRLKADTRYSIQIASDSAAVFAFLDSTADESAAALAAKETPYVQESRLFTGSLPYPVSIQIADDAAKALTTVRVRFSEPMQLSSVVKNVQVSKASGQTIGSCPWSALSRRCADSGTTEMTEIIDFVLSDTASKADLMGAELVEEGTLMGSGRTLAQGLQAAGKPLDATGRTKIGLPAALWSSCSPSGDVLCIRDVGSW